MAQTATDKFSGLCLWLVPFVSSPSEVELNRGIREVMSTLRGANAGCSGEFGTHATLVSALGDRDIPPDQLRDVTTAAVDEWRRSHPGHGLTVGFKDVTTRGRYFQCILLALHPTKALLELNSIANRCVDRHFPPPLTARDKEQYFPHISLLYADLTAKDAQHQIDGLKEQRVFRKNDDGVQFKGFNEITFGSVDVWDCTGRPEDWKKVHSIPL